MNHWRTALREGAVTGTIAGLLSTAVLATVGRRQAGSASSASDFAIG